MAVFHSVHVSQWIVPGNVYVAAVYLVIGHHSEGRSKFGQRFARIGTFCNGQSRSARLTDLASNHDSVEPAYCGNRIALR